MALKHKKFWIDFSGRVGPPIFAATLVGCLLSLKIEWIHIVLLIIGLGLIGINHWYEYHQNA